MTEATFSDRGFMRFPPVPSQYGGEVHVYESSAAMGPHIWVRVVCPSNLNDRASDPVEAVAHLTMEDAIVLRKQLKKLIKHQKETW